MLVVLAAVVLSGCGGGLSSKERDEAADIASDVADLTIEESKKVEDLEDRVDDLEARLDDLEASRGH
jgi:outer membrane murein-binding lipoprotein Lpp